VVLCLCLQEGGGRGGVILFLIYSTKTKHKVGAFFSIFIYACVFVLVLTAFVLVLVVVGFPCLWRSTAYFGYMCLKYFLEVLGSYNFSSSPPSANT
jgi:hypothetical protein